MASGMFLKLGDDPKFRGGCTAAGHAGWIELEHVSWGWHAPRDPAGSGPAPRPNATDVTVSTGESVGTTALFRACLDNTEFPLVLVDLLPRDGAPGVRFELHKVVVPAMSTSPSREGKPHTSGSLRAERITMTSTPGAPGPRAAR